MTEPEKLNESGFEYCNQGDVEKGIGCFRKAAEMGLTIAKHNLACKLTENGQPEEGEKWFVEAAKENYPLSLYYIGVIFEKRNDCRALACYTKSARLGCQDALHALKDFGELFLARVDDPTYNAHIYWGKDK